MCYRTMNFFWGQNTTAIPEKSSRFDICQILQTQVFDGLLAQDELLHFAAGGQRVGLDKQEIAGSLLVTDLLFAKGPQFIFGQFHAVPGTNYGDQFFAEEFIGDAEHLHIGDFRMANKKLLDLDGEDIFAAANDHLFKSTNDVDIAALVHGCQVAGMQPVIAINRLCRLLRHLVVSLHDQEATAAEFTALTTGNNLTTNGVDNLDLCVG